MTNNITKFVNIVRISVENTGWAGIYYKGKKEPNGVYYLNPYGKDWEGYPFDLRNNMGNFSEWCIKTHTMFATIHKTKQYAMRDSFINDIRAITLDDVKYTKEEYYKMLKEESDKRNELKQNNTDDE